MSKKAKTTSRKPVAKKKASKRTPVKTKKVGKTVTFQAKPKTDPLAASPVVEPKISSQPHRGCGCGDPLCTSEGDALLDALFGPSEAAQPAARPMPQGIMVVIGGGPKPEADKIPGDVVSPEVWRQLSPMAKLILTAAVNEDRMYNAGGQLIGLAKQTLGVA